MIKMGIIGYSRRVKMLLPQFLANDVKVAGVYDNNEEYCSDEASKSDLGCLFTSDLELFWGLKYDLVFIGTANFAHTEHIVRAMKEDVNIFSEKPIITKMSDYFLIKKAEEDFNYPQKRLRTGFVLRHSPIFQALKNTVSKIGRVTTVSAIDVIKHTHGAHFYQGWRRFKDTSGGYFVEKIVHSLDILNWCIGSYPVEAFGYSDQDFWIEENREVVEPSLLKRDPDFYENYQEYDPKTKNSFMSDKTLHDTFVANFKYKSGTKLSMTILNYAPNARRSMMFYGILGSVEMVWEMDCCTITYIPYNRGIGTKGAKGKPCEMQTLRFGHLGQHGGGDTEIVKNLVNSVVNDTEMTPSIQEAFQANNACIALQRSIESGTPVKVEL